MGVHGLWRLIDAAGKAIPIETLENRVLAVDVSIWLHQLEKGRAEGVLPGLFRRIAKLLFFRIKPIFVFDGGVPALKRKTIVVRQKSRMRASKAGEKARLLLLENLVKQQLLSKALGTSPKKTVASLGLRPKQDSLFCLPPIVNNDEKSDKQTSSSEGSDEELSYGDLHSIDVKSKEFLSLPPDMRHGILTELNLTRKHSSWATIHHMPQDVGEFSDFQMSRLLKRHSVQVGLSEAEKEMGGRTFTLGQVKTLMEEQGVDVSQRIAADNTTRYIYACKGGGEKIKEPMEVLKDLSVIKEENSLIETSISPSEEEVNREEEEGEGDREDEETTESIEVKRLCKEEEMSQLEIYRIIREESKSHREEVTGDCPGTSTSASYSQEPLTEGLAIDVDNRLESDVVTEKMSKSLEDMRRNTCDRESQPVLIEEELVKQVCEMDKDGTSSEEDLVEVGENGGIQILVDPHKEIMQSEDIFADVFSPKNDSQIASLCEDNPKLPESRLHNPVEEYFDDKDKDVTGDNNSNLVKENLPIKKPLSEEEIIEMQKVLEKESDQLIQQRKKEERLATSLTEQLILDAQELLQLFGVPWVVAPMEAEAQCAFLERNRQTQGTISDDSDIFLFGATNVYKNFFNQNKHVLQFKATDIEHCYNLKREDLILIALLAGSDYTEGLAGIGPVTALEILGCYPSGNDEGDPHHRLVKFAKEALTSKLPHTLAHKLRSMTITPGFPSREVIKAYLEPEVNEDATRFTWALPDLAALRTYTRDKFGWDSNRADATLTPILERLTKTTTQRTLDGYFDRGFEAIKGQMSGRVGKAVDAMKGGSTSKQTKNTTEKGKALLKKPLLHCNVTENSTSSSDEEPPQKKYISRQLHPRVNKKKKNGGLSASAKEARERAARIIAQVKEEKINKKVETKKEGKNKIS